MPHIALTRLSDLKFWRRLARSQLPEGGASVDPYGYDDEDEDSDDSDQDPLNPSTPAEWDDQRAPDDLDRDNIADDQEEDADDDLGDEED